MRTKNRYIASDLSRFQANGFLSFSNKIVSKKLSWKTFFFGQNGRGHYFKDKVEEYVDKKIIN